MRRSLLCKAPIYNLAQGKVTEQRRFSARPWTQTDDNKLRALALTGASSRLIGVQMNRTETAVRSRAGRLKKIHTALRTDRVKANRK